MFNSEKTHFCWFADLLSDDFPFICFVISDGGEKGSALSTVMSVEVIEGHTLV